MLSYARSFPARAREEKEAVKRSRLQAGELSYELDGLRAIRVSTRYLRFDRLARGG
jgi:hypothetical protein